ncbi:D-alanine--D-alanine ligase [Pseudidiomarina marina]|uniref:D-alanine--D-alanine ligase n=1 Tax=Pseudidiomarina marina TaxID=502366 RepID=A0A432YFS8_9GAMM|nr:D-alanine--D-alanine ligase [Pseudidiomarina marina]PHR64784.1 MAG: D-alanine--D-alanine ligase [Idiomarina sp.]RUO59765.1 D-alanine--D-alanine ligase [Pseudidiomarina marina]
MVAKTEFGKVAVLYGGHSAEREVSLRSGQAVLAALQAQGINAQGFDPAEQPLTALVEQQFDRAFIVLHGRGGEDGTIQGALEYLGIPYTGSGVLGCALAMDKVRTKQVWQAAGLPVAPSAVIARGRAVDWQALITDLGGKVMVKPAQEGSSIGMSPARNAAELEQAVALAHKYDREALVESWLSGPEYTVSILGDQALPAIRVQSTHEFYDYDAKYQAGDTQYHCPAGLCELEERALEQLAVTAFHAVGGKGWGRIDVMCDHNGNFKLLEANMVPGMTTKSLVPMAAKAVGMSFEQLVKRILELSEV